MDDASPILIVVSSYSDGGLLSLVVYGCVLEKMKLEILKMMMSERLTRRGLGA